MTANLPWAMASLYFDFFHADRVKRAAMGSMFTFDRQRRPSTMPRATASPEISASIRDA